MAAYFTAIHATLTSGLPNTGNNLIDLADSRVLKTEPLYTANAIRLSARFEDAVFPQQHGYAISLTDHALNFRLLAGQPRPSFSAWRRLLLPSTPRSVQVAQSTNSNRSLYSGSMRLEYYSRELVARREEIVTGLNAPWRATSLSLLTGAPFNRPLDSNEMTIPSSMVSSNRRICGMVAT